MESLNMQLQPFFEWLLRTTLQASLMVCLILMLQRILRSKLGIRWHYGLWLLLLVRMSLPWAPQSRASLFNLIPQSAYQQQTEYEEPENREQIVGSDITSSELVESVPASPAVTTQKSPGAVTTTPSINQNVKNRPNPDFSKIVKLLPLLWLIGALVLAVYVCAGNFNLWKIVKRQRPLTDQKILELLEDCKTQMGIQTILGIVTTDKVKSPALFGFIRPRLLLPAGMVKMLSREELRFVFLHELAHLKRRDIYIGWLISVLQVLHWFNPLVWLAFRRMRADRELACDALVLDRTRSDEPKSYGRIIVSLLERFSCPRFLPGMAGILETKSQLKRRITMIARFKKNSYQWSPLAVGLILILGCVTLPDAKDMKAPESSASTVDNQPRFRKIQIPTEVSWDMRLSPDGGQISLASQKKLWIMPTVGQLGPNIPGEPVELETGGLLVDWAAHAWSADGKWIAFNEEASLDNNEGKGNASIYVISSGGGTPKKVYETYRDQRTVNYRISLSPDGKTLAFSSVDIERKEQHIYTIPVDGGKPKRLVDMQAREPVFSPDGNKIAFVEDGDIGRSGGGLWVVPVQGGTPKQVADAANASSPVWSPRGDMIAFLDYGAKKERINFIQITKDGNVIGDRSQIGTPEGIKGVWLLSGWSPNNQIGAIFERPPESGLYTVPAEGGKAMQVAYGGGQPRWSPDGKRIFCIKAPKGDRGGWRRLAVSSFPSEGGSVTTVPLQSDTKIGLPNFGAGNRMSPDGKRIVFSGESHRKPPIFIHNRIWTVPAEGGTPTQLTKATEENISDMFPCWSPDGNYIAYVHARFPDKMVTVSDVKTNIYTIRQEGGKPTALTTESDGVSFGPIAWSPDGKYIAYYSQVDERIGTGILKIISAKGRGESRVIGKVDQPHPGRELAWSPDSKRIAFNGSDGKSISIMSVKDGVTVNVETGLVSANVGPQLDWSPDGKRFVFAGGKGESGEFWMIENFLPAAVASVDK